MELKIRNTALVVIDMQNSFCKAGGGCSLAGFPTHHLLAAIKPCVELVESARAADIPIIFTRYVYSNDYSDGGVLINDLMPGLREHNALKSGTKDIEIIEQLTPKDRDIIIDKNRPSAFYSPKFEQSLQRLGIKDLVFSGVTTNCCVESTVRDSSQRDYRSFVVEDAVAELDPERHLISLQSMGMLFASIINIKHVKEVWS
jgi:ureidoacrylate peracid hydrolase